MQRFFKIQALACQHIRATRTYTTATATNALLNKYKQQLSQKSPAVWDTYTSLKDYATLEREDFVKLRVNLWGTRGNWGIEEKILQVLEDMRRSGHTWTIQEYNEYFIAKLFQAQYNDILTVYQQDFCSPGGLKLSIGSFNVILATYILLGEKEQAIQLIQQVSEWGVIPDIRDFNRTMNRCVPKNTALTQQAKELITEYGLNSTKAINANLLHLFREKREADVKWILEQQKGKKLDLTTYTILIKGFTDARLPRDALQVYKQMDQHGISPNNNICSHMLTLYAHSRDVTAAEKVVRDTILNGFKPDEFIYNQLIKVYFKARLFQKAFQAFQEVQKTLQVNDVILNTMVNGLVINKEMRLAGLLYDEMIKSQHKPDMVTFNTMLKGYMKAGQTESAMKIITDMFKCNMEPDIVTFTTLIDSIFITKQPTTAKEMISYVNQLNIKPNVYTMNAVINNWIKQGNMMEAENTIQYMQKDLAITPTIHTFTNLIQGYVESMNLEKAMATFSLLNKKGITPDRATFNFMVVGFLQHNRLQDAFACLEHMTQLKLHPTKDTWKLILDKVVQKKDWTIGRQVIHLLDKSGFAIKSDSLRISYSTVKRHV